MQPEVMVQHFALPAVRTVTPVVSGPLHATRLQYRVVTTPMSILCHNTVHKGQ